MRWTTCGAAILAGLSAGSGALCQDAPMFRGNLAHTGVYDVPAVQTLTGVKWRFHTGGRVISSPAVAGGVAYVGSTDGHLYAVDMATGTQRWTFASGSRITSSPAVDGGGVFFSSYDGNVYRVDAALAKCNGSLPRQVSGGSPASTSMDFSLPERPCPIRSMSSSRRRPSRTARSSL